jgi:hypothetical protein
LPKEHQLTDRGEEKIERLLRYFLSRREQEPSRRNCPDEEILARYVDRLLEGDEATRLEAHLARCSLCLENVVAVYKSTDGAEGKKVPQVILDRVLSLVAEAASQENILDLVVRLVKDSLELVSTSGQLVLVSSPVSVRARSQTSETTILQVEKEMAGFKVILEVEQVEAGLCQLVVRTEAEGKRPADGIRLSLFSGDREQASYLTRQGQAVFDRLSAGAYNIAITDSGIPVGTIRLELTD